MPVNIAKGKRGLGFFFVWRGAKWLVGYKALSRGLLSALANFCALQRRKWAGVKTYDAFFSWAKREEAEPLRCT